MTKRPPLAVSFPFAFIFYAVFAACLFQPYFHDLSKYQRLFPFEAVIASAGVFLLCRRWVLSFFASLAGGAVYGFGTYACSLFCFHPFAGMVYALIPWTFLPAVFFYRFSNLDNLNTRIISTLFVFISIIFILAAYQYANLKYFYPIPVQTHLLPQSLLGIVDPIGVKHDIFAPGFYHVCIAGLIMGMAVLVKAQRFGIIALFVITFAAAFYKPFMNVPPVVWASIPVLICSLVIASGLETIILAGKGDDKWLIFAIAVLLLFSIADIFITPHQNIILLSAALYGIGVVAMLGIYFIAEANLSWHLVRMGLLYAAVFFDIIVSTKHNIDLIF